MQRISLLVAFVMLLPSLSFASPATHGPTISLPDVQESVAKKVKKKKKKKKKKGKNDEPPPPPPDADSDGIPDDSDKCADQAEDIDMFEDEDGCPDPDNDGDGITDDNDDCPFEAENVDGWTDEDGCPEAAPAISPMTLSATLNDGTTVQGTLRRLTAVDEDDDESQPSEPTQLEIAVGDSEIFNTEWSNIRKLTAEKSKINTDDFNCYSEGPPGIGEDDFWECTLDYPVKVGLGTKSEYRGTHRISDSKQHRMDFQIADLECSGASCETIEANKTLSVYLYRMIAIEQAADELEAVKSLQTKLRGMHPAQVKSMSLSPKAAE